MGAVEVKDVAVRVLLGPPDEGVERPQKGAATCTVRVDERGLHVDDRLAIARDDILSVRLDLDSPFRRAKPAVHHTVVVCSRRAEARVLTPRTADEARAIVEALGRDPDRIRWRARAVASSFVRIVRPDSRSLTIAAAVLTMLLALGPAAFVVMAIFALVAALAGVLGRGTIEVGVDGLRENYLLGERFIPYADITDVSSTSGALTLTLRDSRKIVLRADVEACAPVLAARVKEASAACASDEAPRELLRPEGEVDASHVAQLRLLAAEQDASYREARVPRERLWRVVENPNADGPTRTRAAVALSGHPSDRERLRTIAEGTTSPKVRVALERTADGHDDARVAEALAELDAEEDKRRFTREDR